MKSHCISEIRIPRSSDGWVTVGSDDGEIEIRMGGARRIAGNGQLMGTLWREFSPPLRILNWFTDDEWVYILFADGSVLAHGFGFISDTGDAQAQVELCSPERFVQKYGPGFLESDLVRQFSPS